MCLVAATSDTPGSVEFAEAAFARCAEQSARLHAATCEAIKQDPTEYSCAYRVETRSPSPPARGVSVIAMQGGHWTSLDGISLCQGIPPTESDVLRLESELFQRLAERSDLEDDDELISVANLRCDDVGRGWAHYDLFSCFFELEYGREGVVEGAIRRRNVLFGRSDFERVWGKPIIVGDGGSQGWRERQ